MGWSAMSWYQDQIACPQVQPATPTKSSARQVRWLRGRPSRRDRSQVQAQAHAAKTPPPSWARSSRNWEAGPLSAPDVARSTDTPTSTGAIRAATSKAPSGPSGAASTGACRRRPATSDESTAISCQPSRPRRSRAPPPEASPCWGDTMPWPGGGVNDPRRRWRRPAAPRVTVPRTLLRAAPPRYRERMTARIGRLDEGTADLVAIVPAGGAGPPPWPLSRAERPKVLPDLTRPGPQPPPQTNHPPPPPTPARRGPART